MLKKTNKKKNAWSRGIGELLSIFTVNEAFIQNITLNQSGIDC